MTSSVSLYIGSAFLGVSMDVLLPLRAYAQHYGARVIHLGPLATDDEIKMYRFRTKKLATWRKQLDELAGSTSLTLEDEQALVVAAYNDLVERGKDNVYLVDWDQLSEDELTPKDVNRLTRLLQARVNEERVRNELRLLIDAQMQRVRALSAVFGDVGYVFSENQVVDFAGTVAAISLYLGTEVQGRHINALSMPANGPKVAHAPITPRTIKRLATIGKSAIMPHPIPMSDSRASEGLNNARNYFTTGMLHIPQEPVDTTDLHKGSQLPGAVVCVYAEDGAFFANNLIVDGLSGAPFIAEDGLVFRAKGVASAPGADCAVTTTDEHAEYTHWGVINGAVHAANALKAETYISNGDMSDCSPVSRHAAGYPGDTEGMRVNKMLDDLGQLMDYISDGVPSLKTRILVDSNHHDWLTDFVAKHPVLKGMLDWKTLAKTRYTKWKILLRGAGGNNIFKFGNLSFRHGDQESFQSALESLGNVINGHWHRYYRLGQSGILGCACRLGPKYLGNALTAWQSQFATHTKVGELTQTSYKTTIHDDEKSTSRFVFRNKVITVGWDNA